MMLEEPPESTKQLCTMKLIFSYVRRKEGPWDFECAPVFVAFMEDLISTLCIVFVSTTLEMFSVAAIVFF